MLVSSRTTLKIVASEVFLTFFQLLCK